MVYNPIYERRLRGKTALPKPLSLERGPLFEGTVMRHGLQANVRPSDCSVDLGLGGDDYSNYEACDISVLGSSSEGR